MIDYSPNCRCSSGCLYMCRCKRTIGVNMSWILLDSAHAICF